jgi:quercetin dioxygenase-like cupin family protein
MEDPHVMSSTTGPQESRACERSNDLPRLGSPPGNAATIAGILLLCSLVFMVVGTVSAAPAPAPQSSKWAAQLPEGNAKTIIVAKCQLCHTLERVVTSNRPKSEWDDLIQVMIGRGAPVSSDEAPIVVDYLAANFGPAGSPPAAAQPASPGQSSATAEGSAKNLVVDPDQAQFLAAPASLGFPDSVKMSIISGDPSKPGLFSVLLKLPASAVIAPHWASVDVNIVALRGTFGFAEGDTFDAAKLQTLNPGAVLHVPAQTHHFAQAKDSTIILFYGVGPLSITSSTAAERTRSGMASAAD